MKVFRFSPAYNKRGFNLFRDVVVAGSHDSVKMFEEAIRVNGSFQAEWGNASWRKTPLPIGDLIGGISQGFSGKRSLYLSLQEFLTPCRAVVSMTGLDNDYVHVMPNNFKSFEAVRGSAHVFAVGYLSMASERFRDEWLRRGLTGAAFDLVAEVPDEAFVPLKSSGQT